MAAPWTVHEMVDVGLSLVTLSGLVVAVARFIRLEATSKLFMEQDAKMHARIEKAFERNDVEHERIFTRVSAIETGVAAIRARLDAPE